MPTQLQRAPYTKGDISIGASSSAVQVIAGQGTARLTFRCDQNWFYSFSGIEGAALGVGKYGPIDAGRDWEIRLDKGAASQSVFVEAVAAATLQATSEPF